MRFRALPPHGGADRRDLLRCWRGDFECPAGVPRLRGNRARLGRSHSSTSRRTARDCFGDNAMTGWARSCRFAQARAGDGGLEFGEKHVAHEERADTGLRARAVLALTAPAWLPVSERSCLARTGELAAPSWMEQSVNVGDVLSLLVQTRRATGHGPGARIRMPKRKRR
jgi:hypothetical protein